MHKLLLAEKRAYKQLLGARVGSAALRVGTPTAYSTANVCAFTKTAGSEQAFVVANVRNSTQAYPLPATLANTTWTYALTGGSFTLGTTLALPAYGYLVLKK
ncbi:alpha-glucosidase C-terminal domain-containing protein [Hymenobacter lapidiphilus]|uniref:Alpha-amylase SusG-like C-terminal domain-containing protein n=1 Tax=Hymenobacter lapidiphilus TaxID=2608003 RepID=A0A7Y7PSP2_9BACT|nr:hypothetical protein [Hymenobacter lapidiphilus]NVO33324.1 hypothetical protein [Hymenobacter lapidiphilus]